MRTFLLIVATCGVTSACSVDAGEPTHPKLTVEEVASMSKATQERHCAVLTEVLPDGAEGYTGSVADQLVEIRSDVVTHLSSMPVDVVSVRREAQIPTSSAPRGWKLSAPCVVWRPAVVRGRTVPPDAGKEPGNLPNR